MHDPTVESFTMNITLKPEYEQFIQAQLSTGRYTAVDDLISAALALLMQREQQSSDLCQKIAVETEQILDGQVIDGETVFAQRDQFFQLVDRHAFALPANYRFDRDELYDR